MELSSRLRAALLKLRPDLFADETLVFPNDAGGFIDPANFRRRVFDRVTRQALGRSRAAQIHPHSLRHTFASLHLARGTNLVWVQRQGGWKSPKVLLDTYTHFVPSEMIGFADALTTPNGPIRPQSPAATPEGVFDAAKDESRRAAIPRGSLRRRVVGPQGLEPWTNGLKVRCSTN